MRELPASNPLQHHFQKIFNLLVAEINITDAPITTAWLDELNYNISFIISQFELDLMSYEVDPQGRSLYQDKIIDELQDAYSDLRNKVRALSEVSIEMLGILREIKSTIQNLGQYKGRRYAIQSGPDLEVLLRKIEPKRGFRFSSEEEI